MMVSARLELGRLAPVLDTRMDTPDSCREPPALTLDPAKLASLHAAQNDCIWYMIAHFPASRLPLRLGSAHRATMRCCKSTFPRTLQETEAQMFV